MIQQSHSSACIWKRQSKICKDTCTPMFTAALFTTSKMWKQPECPSIDKIRCGVCVCIYTCTHIHTVGYYSVIKRMKFWKFTATWMDLEIIIINKDIERHIIWYTCMWDLKKKYKWTYLQKQKQTHKHRKQTYGYQRWGMKR